MSYILNGRKRNGGRRTGVTNGPSASATVVRTTRSDTADPLRPFAEEARFTAGTADARRSPRDADFIDALVQQLRRLLLLDLHLVLDGSQRVDPDFLFCGGM